METVVVYDSKFGNTRTLAQIVAEAVRPYSHVRVFGLDALVPDQVGPVDLLIIGGPTQSHGISARMRQFTDGLAVSPGSGSVAATFDTRYRMPDVVSGSAAKTVARRLKRNGIHVFQRPESFFVTRGGVPQLEPGEAERAAAWAKRLLLQCNLSHWCAA
jgi:flavorubredoxin